MAGKPRNRAGMDAEAVARMMAEQDQVEALSSSEAPAPKPLPQPPGATKPEPEFDPGKVDGRTLRRTGREPFATRIKPETQAKLKRIAYARGITIAEALELSVDKMDA